MIASGNVEHREGLGLDPFGDDHVIDLRPDVARPTAQVPGRRQADPTLVSGVLAARHAMAQHRMIKRGVEVTRDDRRCRPGAPPRELRQVAAPPRHQVREGRERMERDHPQCAETAAAELHEGQRGFGAHGHAHVAEPWRNQGRHALHVGRPGAGRGVHAIAEGFDDRGESRPEGISRLAQRYDIGPAHPNQLLERAKVGPSGEGVERQHRQRATAVDGRVGHHSRQHQRPGCEQHHGQTGEEGPHRRSKARDHGNGQRHGYCSRGQNRPKRHELSEGAELVEAEEQVRQ